VDSPETSAAIAPPAARPGTLRTFAELAKLRLNALVLLTTAVGFALGDPFGLDLARLGWTLLGTGLAAASASMLNQLAERRRDAQMTRTARRPLPTARVKAATVFALGVVLGYAGPAVLAFEVNVLAGALALANILIYVLIYTPLKPVTTLNTAVGAVTGAIPPMIGWAAATGGLETGAWLLGGILFLWQIPHFFALAWMYREDYARGGHAMLPSRDPRGEVTARSMVLCSLLLAPVSLASTLFGVAGFVSAAVGALAAIGLALMSFRFFASRTDAAAKAAFLASLAYLPITLGVMVADRGPLTGEAWVRGGREPLGIALPMPPEPETP
jgi:protoheme IX farnesyltransferase